VIEEYYIYKIPPFQNFSLGGGSGIVKKIVEKRCAVLILICNLCGGPLVRVDRFLEIG